MTGSENTSANSLVLDNVTAAYNGKAVLEEITLQIPHGSQVAVVGPNGAGKSTLFKALVGLIPLRAGQILVHGMPFQQHISEIAYVPQREEVDWRFPVTVQDVIMMGRYGRLGWRRSPSKNDLEIVHHSMQQMDIAALAKKSIGELSGGQQQRVFLARALAQEPHILLMDEPFNGVDVNTQESTLSLLDSLKQRQVTVMVSTHDLSMASKRFELAILLNRRLIAFGPAKDVFRRETILAGFGEHTLFMEGMAVLDECCPPEHGHRHQEER